MAYHREMPRHPFVSPTLDGVGSSVYSKLAERVRNFEGEVFPLQTRPDA
ncbi:MAG: hypothetical protein MPN21_28280 [Thermoanaerobaculia bacterium]|nr:hypothetical protein [Thermoanaerobaculia bacterium]